MTTAPVAAVKLSRQACWALTCDDAPEPLMVPESEPDDWVPDVEAAPDPVLSPLPAPLEQAARTSESERARPAAVR